MKSKLLLTVLLLSFLLTGCRGNGLQVKTSTCTEPGTIQSDRIPHPTQGFDTSFQVYLPPCYAQLKDTRFPVIYLIAVGFELELKPGNRDPMVLSDSLIHAGRMPPAIIVVPEETVAQGYHASLAIDLVPYVDGKYRTLPDRQFRGVGGISHGAAIAARMAFQFPDLFGSLGMLSGGIAEGEKPAFDAWISATAPKDRPRVLIYVGEQDQIMRLTKNLLAVLDAREVPYELNIDPGDHTGQFWADHMEAYLLWFAKQWVNE